jgi:hypothetical protein
MLTLGVLLTPGLHLGERVVFDDAAVFRVLEKLSRTFDLTGHGGGRVFRDEPLSVVLGVAGMDRSEQSFFPEIVGRKPFCSLVVTDGVWLQLRPACQVFFDMTSEPGCRGVLLLVARPRFHQTGLSDPLMDHVMKAGNPPYGFSVN